MNVLGRPAVYVDMMRIVALLLALLIVGCSAERDYIIGDESFTPSERADIERGAAFLAASTGYAPFDIRWEAVPMGEPNIIVRAPLGQDVGGSATVGTVDVILDADQVASEGVDLAAVAAHELGHGLGLTHHDAPGLMNPMATHLVWETADEGECTEIHVCVR